MVIVIALLAGVCASPARAQQGDDKAAAEQLFTQGKALMEKGKLEQACARFEASQKLDPALGTLLNLALCREKQGKVASAWALYREAAVQARREGQRKRETVARERAAALEGDLPRLTIEVNEASQVSGLVVERDGTAVDPAVFGVAVYVDPGVHRVVASAPGYRQFTAKVEVEKGKEASVAIPMLEVDPGAQDKSKREPGQVPDLVRDGGTRGEQDGRSGRTRRIAGLGVGGAGITAMAVGLGVGWSAVATWDDAFSSGLCDRDTLMCTEDGQKQTEKARSRALASNILVGAGVAMAVTGVVLYLTAPRAEKAGVAVVPMAGPSELGVVVQGGF
jgi:tetratricopeptide (TPR) repeat protein